MFLKEKSFVKLTLFDCSVLESCSDEEEPLGVFVLSNGH